MPPEIPKAYEPQEIEKRWAQSWFDEKLFRADAKASGPVFSIALPPPNVTGSIHIGHMLEHTQIDILVRWRRMSGYNTLWLPGMDHAGIAAQYVVERQLAEKGVTRQQLGREEFERLVWKWKVESGDTIKRQMIQLGVSCDWTRERFTLEPALYRSVLEAFLRLYRDGMIYRARYMVNWCPRCQTAISDLEVQHKERNGKLWHIRYPVVGSKEFVVVATTRPETMLGDTAVAVHPEDERYKHLIGKKVLLPLMDREIPIIADEFVDRDFGTGAVKVTPAHDPNDFEMGKRHNLPQIDVMTNDAHMSGATGKYAGLDRYVARKNILADLETLDLLERVTEHTHAVGVCARCNSEIEPRLSVQWFCKMKPLADAAAGAVRDKLISVVPENWEKVYLDWMDRIYDWCISRQLWWGHRIPIWYCADCNAMTPARDSRVEIVNGRAQAASVPEKCGECGSSKLTQETDVLDTWFSSGLWPFSTLGWPDETEDLRVYYPTSLLISGYDILFFWDARMIMMGLRLVDRAKIEERIPFHRLYLHSIVRDPHGMKMSKTRGNVVDPLELTEKHGTDALRFALAVMAAPGTDIALSEDHILSYRAFANKIWNAARFLFFNLEKTESLGLRLEELAAPEIRAAAPYKTGSEIALVDRWIFSRTAAVRDAISDALENYRFHEAAHVIYHFFWGDFCDWYIEWVKPRLGIVDREAALGVWRNLFSVFEAALRLLHPFMPFLTEELWHKLPQRAGAKSIALEPFPAARAGCRDAEAERQMALLQEIIVAVRNLRAEIKVDPKKKIAAEFATGESSVRSLVEANLDAVLHLATLSELKISTGRFDTSGGSTRSTAQFDLRMAHSEPVDTEAEAARLRKEIDRLAKDIDSKRARLADDTFRNRAPGQVVRSLETTLAERQAEHQKLQERLKQIDSVNPN